MRAVLAVLAVLVGMTRLHGVAEAEPQHYLNLRTAILLVPDLDLFLELGST